VKNLLTDRLKNYLLILLSIAVIISGPMLYEEKVKNNREYGRFLNQFYHELDITLSQIDFLLSSYEGDENFDLGYNLSLLDKRLERTHLTLESGNNYVDSEIRTQTYFFMNRIKIPRANDDGELGKNVKEELESIKEGLEYMKVGLSSEGTEQENKNITVKEFNEILKEGAAIGD